MHKHYRLKQNDSLKLWERWVLASSIAQVIVWIVIGYFTQATNEFVNENTYTVLLLVGIVEGFALGFAQWLVLLRYIRYANCWILLTTAGALLSWFMGLTVSVVIGLFYAANLHQTMTTLVKEIALLGAVVGTVIGYAQWLILKIANKKARTVEC